MSLSKSLIVKVCGLSTPEALDAAVQAGAQMVGFVFFEKSPRHVSLDQAGTFASLHRGRVQKVALTVDAEDAKLAAIIEALQPDILQLHGSETLARVAAVKQRFQLPVIKALGMSRAEDLAVVPAYEEIADFLLFDAKPPKGAERPGGNGQSFDWRLLQAYQPHKPWLLSGGLTTENLEAALSVLQPSGVDVSSGVESAPGLKDIAKIEAFVARARAA
jgi:phosphoribosylanthranilate isomerase